MHKAQIAILYKLRHSQSASFSELMHETDLESDVFKFHIQKLIKLNYIYKLTSGEYELTPYGKEFANNLNEEKQTTQKQPKLSMLLIVPRPDHLDVPEYLVQKRMRHPYYGFWGCISGPVQWGEDVEETATRELEKQTGLHASFEVKSFYRTRDYNKETGSLLEDKLFMVLKAYGVEGLLNESLWPHGTNKWMTQDKLREQQHYFVTSDQAINIVNQDKAYSSQRIEYIVTNY